MNTAEKYQGWANRETWCVSLWLNNDSEHLWRHARAVARRGELHEGAKALKEMVTELVSAADGFAADLMGCALVRVDWREVAEGLRED